MNDEITFGTFDKSGLSEQIVARLLTLIRERRLRPGDKLPPERDLAMAMDVGRPSLREALRVLAAMNVVETRHGEGTYVTSLEPGLLVEHLEFVFSLEDATFVQLLEARKVLEVGIAEMAARRISDRDLQGLEDCLARAQSSVHEYDAFLKTDLELHERIAAIAGNPIMSRFMAAISRLGTASRRRTVQLPGVAERSLADHRAIVQALRIGDPAATARAMHEHLENVERNLIQSSTSGSASEPTGPKAEATVLQSV
jgi:GntR family transcriptional repressor for pyruvate dehydrogenase complex